MRENDPSLSGNVLRAPLPTHIAALKPAWKACLAPFLESRSFDALNDFLSQRLNAGARIFPHHPLRALDFAEPDNVRVVIVGQDPYHGAGQAQGLAFSVPSNVRRPPSLRNIFNEVATCCGGNPAMFDNDLTRWARQGVLLLNTLLTVEEGKPASHARKGWESFTDTILACVAKNETPKVFMLWGAHAQGKRALIPAQAPHLILTSNHPSPLSAQKPPIPFIGSGHFRQANEWLGARGLPPINWVAQERA